MGYKTKIREALTNLSKTFVERGAPDPRSILEACIKTMEQGRKNLLEKTYVPNLYRVYMRGKHLSEMGPLLDSIRKELTSHLAAEIRNRKYATTTPGIVVDLVEYADVGRAGFRIEGIFTDDEPRADAAAPRSVTDENMAPTAAPRAVGPTEPAPAEAPTRPAAASEGTGAPTRILEDEGKTRLLEQPAAVLEVKAGETVGRVIKLEAGRHTLGRGKDAAVRFDDPEEFLSRVHAELVVTADATRVLDRQSANGTFVNDRRVDDASLAPGDILRLGKVELVYHGPMS